jgi:hypothetical protein
VIAAPGGEADDAPHAMRERIIEIVAAAFTSISQ